MPHCFFNVELECQIPPLIGTEVRIFFYAELKRQILCLVGTEAPICLWRGTGVQSQCSDLGLAAFFPSLELECGTGVRSKFGIPVPVKGCVISSIVLFLSRVIPKTNLLLQTLCPIYIFS